VITPAAAPAGDADIDLCNTPFGSLAGPVTDINDDERVLWVMGTPVHFDSVPTDTIPDDSTLTRGANGDVQPPFEEIDFEDVELGMMIEVFAWNIPDHRTLDGALILKLPQDTFIHEVRVRGRVDEILMTPNGMIDMFVSMRTKIVITELTHIEYDD
jgi:hypothetical protein